MTLPRFPFVGAGDAQYFEYAELFVRFARAPSEEERDAIGAEVPEPLRDTIEWDGPLLWVASEQGVGRLIRAAYGSGKKKGRVTELTVSSRFAQASVSADGRFNAHIDAWLVAADARVPVLVAFRREDVEAGGTELSAWHAQSIGRVPEVVRAMSEAPVGGDARLAKRLLAWAKRDGVAVDGVDVAPLEAAAEAADRAREEAQRAEQASRASASEGLLAREPLTLTAMPRDQLAAALDVLEAELPAFVKRLRRVPPETLALRAGASEEAIAAVEESLGLELTSQHRALLRAFDGGRVGEELVFLGTPAGGARGPDSIVDFTLAHFGDEPDYVAMARTGRSRLITTWKWKPEGHLMHGEPDGAQSHHTERLFKKIETMLDAVMKAKRV